MRLGGGGEWGDRDEGAGVGDVVGAAAYRPHPDVGPRVPSEG